MDTYKSFEKKIVPYLDGSLSANETSEFEAFVLTHPEFEQKITHKREEIEFLVNRIPVAQLNKDSLEALENEIRSSIYHLLKDEPKNFLDSLKLKWEDLISR